MINPITFSPAILASTCIILSLWASLSLGERINIFPPQADDMRRAMKSDWMNTQKYKVASHTSLEMEYLKSCVPKGPDHPDDDDYFAIDDSADEFGPKAGTEKMTRCTKKEVRQLSRVELKNWAQAFRDWNMKVADNATNRTEMELFIYDHRYPRAAPAHYGPGFLVWHQKYLERFEEALRKHNNASCPPYWDPRLDQCLNDPSDSVLWSKDLMGTRTGPVTEGLFANLTIRPNDCKPSSGNPYLYRDVVLGSVGRYYLYSDPMQTSMFSRAKNNYTELCYPRYSEFEDNHGYCHMWVGGAMAPLACSPNDPMFWMHHQNVDRLFKYFIRDRPMGPDRCSYYPDWQDVPAAQLWNATMSPFDRDENITVCSGLEKQWDIWDMYQAPPDICTTDADCGSEYYFCMNNCNGRRRCSAKLREGARCDMYPLSACYKPLECAGKSMACKDLGSGKVCTCV